MILSVENQAALFLISCAAGAAVAFLFDIFRLFRKIIKHPNFLVQVEDIAYWLIASFIMFYVCLMYADGEIRFFMLLGAAFGTLIYFLALSVLFLTVSLAIYGFLKTVFLRTCRIILFPLKLFLGFIKKPLAFLLKKTKKTLRFAKKLLQKVRGYARIKKRQTIGDVKIILKKR